MSTVSSALRGPFVSAYYYYVAMLSKKDLRTLDILIASAGGVGTTFLIEYLGQFKTTNDPYGRDFLKHLPHPPLRCERDLKVVYVHGDPVDATLSLAARGYLNYQIRKNGNWHCIRTFQDIEEYAQAGRDELYLTKSLRRWSDPSSFRCPALLVKYEALWTYVDEILLFLNIDSAKKKVFPLRKARTSTTVAGSTNLASRLRVLYEEYYQLSAQLGDIKYIVRK